MMADLVPRHIDYMLDYDGRAVGAHREFFERDLIRVSRASQCSEIDMTTIKQNMWRYTQPFVHVNNEVRANQRQTNQLHPGWLIFSREKQRATLGI